jgi:hypothetical protein
MATCENKESTNDHLIHGNEYLGRREVLRRSIAVAGAFSVGVGLEDTGATTSPSDSDSQVTQHSALIDAKGEAKKIAFDKIGNGDKVLLISGFPQTRRP